MLNNKVFTIVSFMALVFSSLLITTLSAPTSHSTDCDPNAKAIHHGETVALQLTPTPTEWLSCSTDNIQGCLTSSCPGLYIEEDDWTNCQTESLGIFRALGTGQIRVGDLIALHHSQKPGTWLSCNSTDCKLSSSCLGLPSLQNGFHIGVQWPDCLEQVFRIHARNKNTGQIVECGDSVSLQPFLSTNGRLNHEGGRIHIDECSSESTGDRYEECNRETFTVWTKQ